MMVKHRKSGDKSVKKTGALPSNRSVRYAGAMTKAGKRKGSGKGKRGY